MINEKTINMQGVELTVDDINHLEEYLANYIEENITENVINFSNVNGVNVYYKKDKSEKYKKNIIEFLLNDPILKKLGIKSMNIYEDMIFNAGRKNEYYATGIYFENHIIENYVKNAIFKYKYLY